MGHFRIAPVGLAAAGVVLSATALGSPVAAAAGWSAPYLISATNFVNVDDGYSSVSLTADSGGKLHAAVSGVGNGSDGIWYVTNTTGSWTLTRVTNPKGASGPAPHDFYPSIATDLDGTASIAFTRINCTNCAPNPSDGVSYITNAGGTWSKRQILSKAWADFPSLLMRNGHVYVAYEISSYTQQKVDYTTDAAGSWTTQKLAGAKSGPALMLTSGDVPRIVAIKSHATLGLWKGTSATTLGQAQTIPDAKGKPRAVVGALDQQDRPTVAWTAYNANWQQVGVYVSSFRDGAWTAPRRLLNSGQAVGVAVDANGRISVLVIGEDQSLLYYFSKDNGLWGAVPLYEGKVGAAALAVDGEGQAHVIFTVGKSEPGTGLYYMTGMGF